MSKKQDAFYFDNFVSCAECACRASELLNHTLADFRPEEISSRMDEMHEIERMADDKRHELSGRLIRAFITPLEREDIAELSHHIDEMVDKIEDVMIRIYINNVQSIRPEAVRLAEIVGKCCTEVQNLLKEFEKFKRPAKLDEKIIAINSLEEEADTVYIARMRKLHEEEKEPLEIITWREIYDYLEKCADACEHVADTVGSVIMKNS